VTDDLAATVRALAARVQALEDEREVATLVASYGPLVDTGDPAVAELWLEDGVYDVDELLMEGSSGVAEMVTSAPHQRFVAGGCAHVQGPVAVTVSGDTAVAVGYSLMLVHDGSGYRLRRVTANHWSLARYDGRWRVARRTSRQLDGREEARALLRGDLPS
jgi:ketosteroid isomerase-like protein